MEKVQLTNDLSWTMTREGGDFSLDIEATLANVMERVCIGKMNPYEAEAIAIQTITTMFAEYRLTHGARQRKAADIMTLKRDI